jgi:uncharacterized protein Yka (UPF0111/DUF47 family)
MRRSRWFLPSEPDVLGLLRAQIAATLEGIDAFVAWAAGDTAASDTVRAAEHRADAAKRDVFSALRDAFVTPIEPEDLFAISRGVDWILNHAKDLIRESEVMACPPDAALAGMACEVAEALQQLAQAVERLGAREDGATVAADAAIKAERRLEKRYRDAMAALLADADVREVTARRELYRRCSRIGESAVDVAERVIYAVVKES